MSSGSINAQFLSAMRKAGFEPDCQIVADGRLHHFRDWLDKPETLNGWYVLFSDSPSTGAFGCRRRGLSEMWSELESNLDISCHIGLRQSKMFHLKRQVIIWL
jgi:putative DNA primase/helicase